MQLDPIFITFVIESSLDTFKFKIYDYRKFFEYLKLSNFYFGKTTEGDNVIINLKKVLYINVLYDE